MCLPSMSFEVEPVEPVQPIYFAPLPLPEIFPYSHKTITCYHNLHHRRFSALTTSHNHDSNIIN